MHRSWFLRLHERPWRAIVVAVVLAALALVLVTWGAGWSAVGHAFADFHPVWIALCVPMQGVALGAYALAYRAVACLRGGPHMPLRMAVRVVAAGFGAFAVGGGFWIDQRALHAVDHTPRRAAVRVLGLGSLEYAVLAPAACVSAIALLVGGGGGVQGAVLWPWAIAVPIGCACGLWASAPHRRSRIGHRGLRTALDGMGLLRQLAGHPLRHGAAWLGMTVYWAADIATLYGALRLFGVHLGAAATILGYATGYALTRRTLPLGGAGVTEALLSVALLWVGLPLARAVPAVLAYRVANFLLPLGPAVRAHRDIKPLLYEAEARRAGDAAPPAPGGGRRRRSPSAAG